MKAKKKMSMYKKGGFNPQPDTSYQSPASKSARAKSKNKRKQILAAYTDFLVGNNRAAQAQQEMRSSFRQGDKEAGLKAAKEAAKFAKKRKSALEKGEKLFDKDLSEFKEYKGGGKMYGKKGMKVKKYAKGGPIVPDNKGKTAEDQAMAIVKQKGAERRAALQPFYDLESEVNAARKTYDEHVERLKVLNKGGRSYNRMLQTLRKDREAIANLLKDDRMNIEGVSGVEKSNLMRMMPK
jgi:hypothetical protein